MKDPLLTEQTQNPQLPAPVVWAFSTTPLQSSHLAKGGPGQRPSGTISCSGLTEFPAGGTSCFWQDCVCDWLEGGHEAGAGLPGPTAPAPCRGTSCNPRERERERVLRAQRSTRGSKEKEGRSREERKACGREPGRVWPDMGHTRQGTKQIQTGLSSLMMKTIYRARGLFSL